MKINEAGRKIILEFEGISKLSYPDPASLLARELQKKPEQRLPNWTCLPGDPWTIGIGATGPGIGPGLIWSEKLIMNRFEKDLVRFEKGVWRALTIQLNENQFSALVSFTFNVGFGRVADERETPIPGLLTSTLLRRVNDGDFARAAAQFPLWENAGGRPIAGLRRRRLAEQKLFLTPVADQLAVG